MACFYFLACFICTSCLVAGQSPKYILRGTRGYLRPDLSGQPSSILWTHDGNKVVEFDGSEEQVYSPYEDRITLDWHSAELDITDLRFKDSGVYDLEVDINNNLHTSQYKLVVIDKVATPKVSCEMNKDSTSGAPDIKATLLCSAEPRTPESLMKFEWTSGRQGKLQLGPKLEIPLGDKDDEEEYSCSVSNPLSSETATFTAKECYKGTGLAVALGVGIPVFILLLVAVLGTLYWRKKACFAQKQSNDPEKQSPTTGSDGNTAQPEEDDPLLPVDDRKPEEMFNKMTDTDKQTPPKRNRGLEGDRDEHKNIGSTVPIPTLQQDDDDHDADQPEETAQTELPSSESSDLQEANKPDPAGEPDEHGEDEHSGDTPALKTPGSDKETAWEDGDNLSPEGVSPVSSPGPGDCGPSDDETTLKDNAATQKEEDISEEGYDRDEIERIYKINDPDEQAQPKRNRGLEGDRDEHKNIVSIVPSSEVEPPPQQDPNHHDGYVRDEARRINKMTDPDKQTPPKRNRGSERGRDEHRNPVSAPTSEVAPTLQQDPNHHDADQPEETAQTELPSSESSDLQEANKPDPAGEPDESDEDEHSGDTPALKSPGYVRDEAGRINKMTDPDKQTPPKGNRGSERGRDEHRNPVSAPTSEVAPTLQQDPNHHDADQPEETAQTELPSSESSDLQEANKPDPAGEPDESDEDEHSGDTPALKSPGYVRDEAGRINKMTDPDKQTSPKGNRVSDSEPDKPEEGEEASAAAEGAENSPSAQPKSPKTTTAEQNEEPEAGEVHRETPDRTVSGSDLRQNEDESSKHSEDETPSTPDKKDSDPTVNKQDSTVPQGETHAEEANQQEIHKPVLPAENETGYVNDDENDDKIQSPAKSQQHLDSTIKTEEPGNTESLRKSPDTPHMNPEQKKENQSGQDLNESERPSDSQTIEAGKGEGKTGEEVKEIPKDPNPDGENQSED